MTLISRDKAILWHPFTQAQTEVDPVAIVRGEGAYLYDENGKSYLDLVSSWWVNLHGHGNEVIAKRIYTQAQTLEHVMFAGFTHDPAISLCEQLKTVLPTPMQRFFFSDNGSTAVEAALKMAYQFWCNQGQTQRFRFMSFEGGYHGDTFGAMAVGKSSGFHTLFQRFFFDVTAVPYPATWENDAEVEAKEKFSLLKLEQYLVFHGDEIAAFIIEPLMQGASGMRMVRPVFLQQVIDRVRSYGILIIFDEVMTGFCRTGTYFAMEQVDRCPDILCLSKGLTGGFLPLALTVTTAAIYEAFLSTDSNKAFLHGHSYTANPLGCAAACASFELLQQKQTQDQIKSIESVHRAGVATLCNLLPNRIKSPRVLGTIAAFELPTVEEVVTLKRSALAAGLLIRPLGKTVYILPPYCISSEALTESYKIIEKLLINY